MSKSLKKYPWQQDFFKVCKDVIDHPCNQVVALKARRQLSKSFSSSLIAIYALNNPYWRIGYLCPVFKQARKVFKVLQSLDAQYNLHLDLSFNESRLEIKSSSTNSVIIFMSSNQGEDLRGETFNLLIIDEAAYVRDSVYDILMPTRIVHRAPLILVSTPLLKSGRFYEFFTDSKTISVDWNDYDTSQVLTDEDLSYFQKRLAPALFKTDYLGEFLDSGTSLLFGDLTSHKHSVVPSYKELYVGIDFGYGSDRDFTSIVAINENYKEVFVEHFNHGGIIEQEKAVLSFLTSPDVEPFIKNVMMESNSLGAPMIEHIISSLESTNHSSLLWCINSTYWDRNTKARDVAELISKVQTGLYSFLDIDWHINEVANYTMKIHDNGQVEYGNATKKQSEDLGLGTSGAPHDDSICASAHALFAKLDYYEVDIR